jgi:hypothetical protein
MTVHQILLVFGGVPLPAVYDPLTVTNESISNTTSSVLNFNVNADGTWETINNGVQSQVGNWAVPSIPPNVGDLFWVRFTRTSFSTSGDGLLTATDTTGWVNLTTNQGVVLTAQDLGAGTTGQVLATYTTELAGDSSGINIVSTTTGLQLGSTWN